MNAATTQTGPAAAGTIMTPLKRLRRDWKHLANKMSYKGIVGNIPFLAFVAVLLMLVITNSHHALEVQRELTRQQKILKELRWHHEDINAKLMNAGMEREIIQRGSNIGLYPLTLPAYSIHLPPTQNPR